MTAHVSGAHAGTHGAAIADGVSRRTLAAWAMASAAAAAGGCVNVGLAGDDSTRRLLSLRDPGPAPARRGTPLVPALLIQPVGGQAFADGAAIAYSERPGEFAFYQLAGWTDRPVRQVPRLLQRRLEVAGLAGAVGQIGDPLESDWLLTIEIESLFHDVHGAQGRVALRVALYQRPQRRRMGAGRFEASAAVERAQSPAAADAMSIALGRVFDDLLSWLESTLRDALPHAADGAKARP